MSSISRYDIECVLIGHNEVDFSSYIKFVSSSYEHDLYAQTLMMDYFLYNGKRFRVMDVVNDTLEGDFYNGTRPSFTLAYLASYLSKRNITVALFDDFSNHKEKLGDVLRTKRVGCVAVTTTLYMVDTSPLVEVINSIRQANKNVPIIVGGPMVLNFLLDDDLNVCNHFFDNVDANYFICNTEGERALSELIKALVCGFDTSSVKNMFSKYKGLPPRRIVVRPEGNRLEDEPVDWDKFYDSSAGSVSVRTSVSCQFSCAFCTFPIHGGAFRKMPVYKIVSELEHITASGVNHINFIDDTLNSNKKKFDELLGEIIQRKINIQWNAYIRCQFVDDETADLMVESGCVGVYLGIESASDKILKNMNKKVTTEDYRRGISWLKSRGIMTHANYIIGFPGETEDTIKNTIDFIEEVKTTFYRVQLWYCSHIAPIWKKKHEFGIEGDGYSWSHSTMNSSEALSHVWDIGDKIKSSVRLPQESFNTWGVFTLRRYGFSVEDICDFLREFNKAVYFHKENPGKSLPSDMYVNLQSMLRKGAAVNE